MTVFKGFRRLMIVISVIATVCTVGYCTFYTPGTSLYVTGGISPVPVEPRPAPSSGADPFVGFVPKVKRTEIIQLSDVKVAGVERCAHGTSASESFYWDEGSLWIYVCNDVSSSNARDLLNQVTSFQSLPGWAQDKVLDGWKRNMWNEWKYSMIPLVSILGACWILFYALTWVIRGFASTTK